MTKRPNPEDKVQGPLWVDITARHDDEVSRARVRDRHYLTIDEPDFVPYGTEDPSDRAPCPGDYLLVATAGCQAEVLKHCFEKARIGEYEIRVHASRETEDIGDIPEPLPKGKSVRYSEIHMELEVTTTKEFEGRVRRCLDVCEHACIISRSVEAGIDFTLDRSLVVRDEASD